MDNKVTQHVHQLIEEEAWPLPAPAKAQVSVRRKSGLRQFLRHNLRVLVFLFCGALVVTVLYGGTSWYASQSVLECAPFTTCQIDEGVQWVRDHIGIIQGLLTFLYIFGLGWVSYMAYALFEAGLWVVLYRQPLSIAQMEGYLAVAQGSIVAIPSVILASKSIPAKVLLLFTILSALAPFSGAPLVGYVLEQSNFTIDVQSEWAVGGGIGPIFAQNNPPSSVSAGTVSLYTAWSRGISIEPMSEYRDWYFNRKALAERGNMTVEAIRMQRNVSCQGTPLTQINIPAQPNGVIELATQMKASDTRRQNKTNSESVKLRTYPGLNVWADSFTFINENRTSSTLIFAAANGAVTNSGFITPVNDTYIKSISAIKCSIDVEFVDDTLVIGNGGSGIVTTLSKIEDLHIGHCNSSSPAHGCDPNQPGGLGSAWPGEKNTLNEIILWFTMSPILSGISVDGNQPQFEPGSSQNGLILPKAYTSSDPINNTWTIVDIERLINVSMGAMAIQSSSDFLSDNTPVNLTSTVFTRKLSNKRPPLLLVPLGVQLVCIVVLLMFNILLHNRLNLPIMRRASLRELSRSMQTSFTMDLLKQDAEKWHKHSTLGDVAVSYGAMLDSRGRVEVGLGNPDAKPGNPGYIRPFEKGPQPSTVSVQQVTREETTPMLTPSRFNNQI